MNIPQPPPMPMMQTALQDESHLNLLSVFHYVLGGLWLLMVGFVILHFMVMSFVFSMASSAPHSASQPAIPISAPVTLDAPVEITTDVEIEKSESGEISSTPVAPAPKMAPAPMPEFPKEMIGIFAIFYIAIGTFFCGMAIANFLSGQFIKKRKNKIFSFVVAAINCVQVPFGTVLGIFTIIVLSRMSVKMAYEVND